ncbi:hypothetical protein [Psychroflexus tropicus]|uniref:hypothetical protein n=1 Tax=Psychroflexus tropicus TaxID=197345 RepID=UPI00035D86A4|nr:hypothetical protein [Psychroflexus tropicus]
MKTLNLFLGYLTVIVFLSCTSDDDNTGTTPIQQENGFTYQGSFFETPHLFINDENTIDDTPSDISISLLSVDPFETSQSSDVDFVFFDFQGVDLQPETITDVLDY